MVMSLLIREFMTVLELILKPKCNSDFDIDLDEYSLTPRAFSRLLVTPSRAL